MTCKGKGQMSCKTGTYLSCKVDLLISWPIVDSSELFVNKLQKSLEQKKPWKTVEGCENKCSYSVLEVIMVRFSAGHKSTALSAETCDSNLKKRQGYMVGDEVVHHITRWDLALSDYYLYLQLKGYLGGQCYNDNIDVNLALVL